MHRYIAVPIEGTGHSGPAVDLAIDLARRGGGTVELVAVHELPGQKLELEAARSRVEAAGLVASVTVLQGKVAEALADYVAASDADLVIMTPRSGPLERLAFGSVTSEVVRRGGKPVLMLPADAAPRSSTATLRVLVPLDGSELSDQVIPHVERIARRVDAQIILFTVVEADDGDDGKRVCRRAAA
jgi:nucleotide-binding universal stress UspA family protein